MFEQYQDENGHVKYKLAEISADLHPEWHFFSADYNVDLVILHPDQKPGLKLKPKRTCRFCGQSMPVVTFKKEAHTISQFTGNRNLISDFECDTCNELFSKYESQLTYFLGISRTLSMLQGQAGVPKFKTPDKNLEARIEDGGIIIISEGMENKHWEIDEDTKRLKIYSVKQPYIPIQVFKALLKFGLCEMEEEFLSGFEKAFKLLQTNEHDAKLKDDPMFRVYIHVLAGAPIPIPVIFRMKKKELPVHDNCPTFCFILYFGNYILQFFMPLYIPDREPIMKDQTVFLPVCPPFVGENYIRAHGRPKRGNFHLSGTEPVKNEKQVITMSFDRVAYQKGTDKA